MYPIILPMSKATYLVHFELTKNGHFIITVPKLPGCRATAATFEQALQTAKKAIEEHLKALANAGKSIPVESQKSLPLCCQIQVESPKIEVHRSHP